MKTISLLGVFLSAVLFAGCSSSTPLTTANPGTSVGPGAAKSGETLAELRSGPNGVTPRRSSARGWLDAPVKEQSQLLYVSNEGAGRIDIYSIPRYSLVGQITDGISQPEGLATDKKGNLYVANLSGNTITVYKQGTTTPWLTLTDSSGPQDVAVAENGYVFASDYHDGGVDVYPPGATSPSAQLTNAAISDVLGVGVDEHNNVYAVGIASGSLGGPVVVEYTNMSEPGTNLFLEGLSDPDGVLIDKQGNIVVSDYFGNAISIYRPGQTFPSSWIPVFNPDRSVLNKQENAIYIPGGGNATVSFSRYPATGSAILPATLLNIGNFTTGAALFPPAP